jgi:hypothetical protein
MRKMLLSLALALLASPALAKDCVGTWTATLGDSQTIDLGNGQKMIVSTSTSEVRSENTPYNGSGDGQGMCRRWVASNCIPTPA